jgi:hypothetical protein
MPCIFFLKKINFFFSTLELPTLRSESGWGSVGSWPAGPDPAVLAGEVPDPSQQAWIRPFWPGKGQISARTAGFGQPVRIQLFWPANERFPARTTETAGSGQLARIQLIWPGNEQILASWQRQGRPALQILRWKCQVRV